MLIELIVYAPAPLVGFAALIWWWGQYQKMESPKPRAAWWMLAFRCSHFLTACVLYAAVIMRYTQSGLLWESQGVVLRAVLALAVFLAQSIDLLWIGRRNGKI